MDGEDEGREEIAVSEGEEARDHNESNATSIRDQVTEILSLIESVAQLGDYRRTHRRECGVLVRRLKLLLPFLEEIRDVDAPATERSVEFIRKIKKVVLLSRKLLKACNGGSKIYQALESEAIMIRFHSVYEKLIQGSFDVPFEELGISDEVKEQVELLSTQLRRANKRTDTQDIELAVDLMVAFSKTKQLNADTVILERIAKKLELNTIEDLNVETVAVRNLVHEKSGPNAETAQQIIDLLNKFKQLLGVEVSDILHDPILPKSLKKSVSLAIPHEFLCPITLEIMTDPVIVASGQTYERESIQKWFDAGQMTCPKTRETLAHLSLAPNYALKNLILQWCERNNYKLPEKENPSCSENASTDQNEEVLSFVIDLSSSNLETQRQAVKKIRMLAKENPENRVLIADSGGIPPLVQLLSYPDSKIQENAVTALLNLSIDEKSKKLISSGGAIPHIIEILKNGRTEAKENSAAALFSLSMLDENKAIVGSSNGILPLVELLQNGTIRGKRDALTALFNLSLNSANKGRAIDAGIVSPLLQVLKNQNLGMIDEALSVFLLLAGHPKGREAIGQLEFIETIVGFIKQGTPRNKECATSVLLELGSNNSSFILSALQFGVYEHLEEISRSGTNRGQRKANALLQLISKTEQIP